MVTLILPSLSDPPAVPLQLTIPLEIIQTLCFRPAKWLRFVGWTIFLTSEGYLSRDTNGNDRLADDTVLVDTDMLFYNAPGIALSSVIDVDAVARRTASRTSANDARVAGFATTVITRMTVACHIIPFARGSEWIQIISRYRFIEPVIEDINDPQNGFTCFTFHDLLEKRQAAILVTPNDILECDDVPALDGPANSRDNRPSLPGLRYTFQHLQIQPEDHHYLHDIKVWNNRDARFRNSARLPHPALLHYVYGASILKIFGESATLWKSSGKWVRPSPYQDNPSQRGRHSQGSRDSTQEQRQNQTPSPYPSASTSSGGRTSRRRITEDEAMEYMFNIASKQVAHREHAAWEQRKLEINAWVNRCARGVAGSREQDGLLDTATRT
ncbi:hypothetical protein HGRIS_000073 [Hohenbuehelia grisea]|uniref:HNH nuclease domain-containing protein n=1 Tax=Hohenbuehelia grisea TaxID=104357 RepID=A0ABR3JQX7_9AGAR